jgi:hypothetical protein
LTVPLSIVFAVFIDLKFALQLDVGKINWGKPSQLYWQN